LYDYLHIIVTKQDLLFALFLLILFTNDLMAIEAYLFWRELAGKDYNDIAFTPLLFFEKGEWGRRAHQVTT